MKRFFCFLFVLVLLPVVSFADQPSILSHYSLCFDARLCTTGKGANPFDYDMLCLDVYFTDDESMAYFSYAQFFSGTYIANSLLRMTVAQRDNGIYLIDGQGSAIFCWYDENGIDLWMHYRDHDLRLHPTTPFSMYEDWF